MNQLDLVVMLEEERFKHGSSQLQICMDIGISLQTYQSLKRGNKTAAFKTISLIVRFLKSRGYDIDSVDVHGMKIVC